MPLLRQVTNTLLAELLPRKVLELAIYIVGSVEMTHLNETFLGHSGSTDVITFDYSERASPENQTSSPEEAAICGEIFVCLDEAVAQAGRFRTTWQMELTRYVVHGVLHLCGFDDKRTAARRRMKRAEARLLRRLASTHKLGGLGPGIP
jgi:probable rRNA maturation factor